jgi:hypothetical protein
MEHQVGMTAEYGLEWRITLPEREVMVRPRVVARLPHPTRQPHAESAAPANRPDSAPHVAYPRIYANLR